MYQSDSEYPSLHLMVTDNDRYQVGRLAFKDVDEALKRIERWLREKTKA